MTELGEIRRNLHDSFGEPGRARDEEGLWALLTAVRWPDPTPELDGLDAYFASAKAWLEGRSFTARMAIWDAYRALTQQLSQARRDWAKTGAPVLVPQGAYPHQLDGYAVRRGREVYRATLASCDAASALAASPGFLAHSQALIGFEDVFSEIIDKASDEDLAAYATSQDARDAQRDLAEAARLDAAWDALREQPALEEPHFWEAVGAVRWEQRDDAGCAARLIAALEAQDSPARIVAFSRRRHTLLHTLEQRILAWEAETGRTLECGDDSFRDLMNHVIGLGQAVYEATITSPELAAARADGHDYRESFAYVEQWAWHEVMGARARDRGP